MVLSCAIIWLMKLFGISLCSTLSVLLTGCMDAMPFHSSERGESFPMCFRVDKDGPLQTMADGYDSYILLTTNNPPRPTVWCVDVCYAQSGNPDKPDSCDGFEAGTFEMTEPERIVWHLNDGLGRTFTGKLTKRGIQWNDGFPEELSERDNNAIFLNAPHKISTNQTSVLSIEFLIPSSNISGTRSMATSEHSHQTADIHCFSRNGRRKREIPERANTNEHGAKHACPRNRLSIRTRSGALRANHGNAAKVAACRHFRGDTERAYARH